jgi:CubicO group peptidase (beta-lactamase class C family)
MTKSIWNRRRFLETIGAGLLPMWSGTDQDAALEGFILDVMKTRHVPGVAVAKIERGRVAWSKGFGLADVERRTPMTPESVLNIGSVTKTITATAVMQLVERGRLDLDADVNAVLPFPVRNGGFPSVPITVRQLLTHTSSIRDTPEYEASYGCGDPAVPLADWVERYLTGGRTGTPAAGAFATDAPGQSWAYSNVGFGLLGVVIEGVSKQSYADYTTRAILVPLGMTNSRWYLRGADRTHFATPYDYVATGEAKTPFLADPAWVPADHPVPTFVPHCLYSFPTLPDGLLRTTVLDLARFLGAYQGGGRLAAAGILAPKTVAQIWTAQPLPAERRGAPAIQGLAWYQQRADDPTWQHSGGDPGISTFVGIGSGGIGVAVICNSGSGAPVTIGRRVLGTG